MQKSIHIQPQEALLGVGAGFPMRVTCQGSWEKERSSGHQDPGILSTLDCTLSHNAQETKLCSTEGIWTREMERDEISPWRGADGLRGLPQRARGVSPLLLHWTGMDSDHAFADGHSIMCLFTVTCGHFSCPYTSSGQAEGADELLQSLPAPPSQGPGLQ